MSKIVVCKLVRLGMDGDKFKKELVAQEERTSVKITKEEMTKQNKLWKTTGRLYILDEDKTKEREAQVEQTAADKAKATAETAGANEKAKEADARIAEANARKAEAEAAEAEAKAEAAKKAARLDKPKTEREQLIEKAAALNITHAKDATIAKLKELIAEAEDLS